MSNAIVNETSAVSIAARRIAGEVGEIADACDVARENRSAANLDRDLSPLDCADCGGAGPTYAWFAGSKPRMICLACRAKAIADLAEKNRRDTRAAELLKFEEVTASTQKPRELSHADVTAKLDLVGLESEHLESVLALAIIGLEKERSTEEFVSAVQGIRHVRTVLIGSLAEGWEARLVEAIKTRWKLVEHERFNAGDDEVGTLAKELDALEALEKAGAA